MNVRAQKGCHCESYRETKTFSDWNDFDHFSLAISNDLGFSTVPTPETHANVGLREKWYRCDSCGTITRLVEPDPPFKGLWKRV